MQVARALRDHCRAILPPLAGCAILCACATSSSDPAAPQLALFRVPFGKTSDAVAPGLRSGWKVQRGPVSFAQVGMAGWSRDLSQGGLGAVIAWIFGHPSRAQAAAVVSAASALPVPSIVEVTELRSFKTIAVRVDHKADLGEGLIALPRSLARGLGAEDGQPIPVRIRYQAPVLAWREPPTLGEAMADVFAGPGRPRPTLMAARASGPPSASADGPARPVQVAHAIVKPPAPAAFRLTLAMLRPSLDPPAPSAGPASFRIEAGAFASLANARRAVESLSPDGKARIIPIRRGDVTLYGVVLEGRATPASAEALRVRVLGIGFTGARLVQPL
ncbi:MAG: SPOR domain-containing protein [Alphaproteobacteria bacterium]|nr:SPOR domain-containing protein [Alphaproteobacteria bacterium]